MLNARVSVRAVAVYGAALFLVACGGGASAPVAPRAAATAARAADATATLTIAYPAGFHRLPVPAATPSAGSRSPAYVNPTSGNYLFITVDGTPIPGSPFAVAPTPDQRQSVVIPL